MHLEVRSQRLSKLQAPPSVEPMSKLLMQVPLHPEFTLERFGFRTGSDGRFYADTFRLRPIYSLLFGSTCVDGWEECRRRHRVHSLRDTFGYEAIAYCPFTALSPTRFAFVCRSEPYGPIRFWTRSNTGYQLVFCESQGRWFAEFNEPVVGIPPRDQMLAGFTFQSLRHRLVSGGLYAADAAGGLLKLFVNVGGVCSLELDETVYGISDPVVVQVMDEMMFFKLQGQDRVIVVRDRYHSVFETELGFRGNAESEPWGVTFCRRVPVWKSVAEPSKVTVAAGAEGSFQQRQSLLRRVFQWFS